MRSTRPRFNYPLREEKQRNWVGWLIAAVVGGAVLVYLIPRLVR